MRRMPDNDCDPCQFGNDRDNCYPVLSDTMAFVRSGVNVGY